MKGLVYLFLSLLFSALLLQSCDKEKDPGNLELTFRLMYDGQPLVAAETYNYPLGFDFFISKYSMFISEMALVGEGDIRQLVGTEFFMDLAANQTNAVEANAGTTVLFENILAGEYTSLNLSVGLPGNINQTTPAEYTSESPLSNTGEYWAGWESYIFHKIEGKLDSDGDGVLESGIALHIGSNDAYRTKQLNKEIEIKCGETTKVTFDIDFKEVMTIAGEPFDILETPQVHHLGVLPKVLPIMDNLIAAFE